MSEIKSKRPIAAAHFRTLMSLPYSRFAHADRGTQGLKMYLRPFSWTFFGGMNLSFPEEMTHVDKKQFYTKAGALIPTLLKINDACDLGMGALMRYGESEDNDLLRLFDALYTGYHVERTMEQEKFNPRDKEILNMMEQDAFALATLRQSTPPSRYREYLEIDSALFEATTYEILLPGSLTHHGFDIKMPCVTLEDFAKKYHLIVGKDENPDPSIKAIRAAQAIEMLMKIGDDSLDVVHDELIHMPNMVNYVLLQTSDHKEQKKRMQQMQNEYLTIASAGGYPKLFALGCKKIMEVFGKVGLIPRKKNTHIDFDEFLYALEQEVGLIYRDSFFVSDQFQRLFTK